MAAERVPVGRTTVVGRPGWERLLVWGGFPLAGAALGGLVWLVAGWVVSLRWVPMRGPFKLVDSLPDVPAALGCLGVGAAAGLVLAFLAEHEYVTVVVSDDRVVCTRAGVKRSVPRAAVKAVFADEGRLVLLDRQGREAVVYSVRESADLPDAQRLARAFKAHGYPWSIAGDPYRSGYRRWVPDMDGLPAGANALLRARARALEGGDGEEAAQLREELARMGLVVREDRKKRQFWRSAPPLLEGPGR